MDLNKIKEVNEFIVAKSCEKIKTALDEKGWDKEVFEVFSQAIDNLKDIEKIEAYEYKEKERTVRKEYVENEVMSTMKKVDVIAEETEFEVLLCQIMAMWGTEKGFDVIKTLLADHMEDVRLFNKKMYDMAIMKLKNVLY